MQAVEFYAQIKDGMIEVPKRHLKDVGSHVRIIMLNENPEGFVVLEESDKKVDSVMGSLNRYANPGLIPLEEGAWRRAVAEKHDIN